MAAHATIKSVKAVVGRAEQTLVAQVAGNRELMLACSTRHYRLDLPVALSPTRRRLLAVYIAAVELAVANDSDIARALGISRQAVKQGRDRIDDLRDNPAVDELLTRAANLIAGR